MAAEKSSVMKSFWSRIKDDIFVWLVFYFIFTLPMTVHWAEYFDTSVEPFPNGEITNQIGGSATWYLYYFWYMGHRQSCFLFATVCWVVYKGVLLLYRKLNLSKQHIHE
jgi:hypothetical protein